MTPVLRGPLFITFEGVDGCGKSTQIRRLADRLMSQGQACILTREPGGSTGAEEIRALVLEGEPDRWSPEVESLLFTAARRDHLEKTIRPAMSAGKVVLCDRFADSTRVYQGVSRGDLRGFVNDLHALAIGVEPDITVLLDIDPQKSHTRALAREGGELRFESFGLKMQQKMRSGFLELAQNDPVRFVVVDAEGSEEDVAARVEAGLIERLASHG